MEIERKFLVDAKRWAAFQEASPPLQSVSMTQGYFVNTPEKTVRVRIHDGEATLTLKAALGMGVRDEFEVPMPIEEARALLATLSPVLDKTRTYVPYEGHLWEVDVFHGGLEGLVLAEVELNALNEACECPPFVTDEVTEDARYLNAVLLTEGLPHDDAC